MEALSGVRLRDRAALIDGVLVLADLHVGKAAAANVEAPVGAGEDMVERADALCARFEPETVVVAGDLLHSFEHVPSAVEDTVAGLRRAARRADARMVVVPGNHDTLLDAVWGGPTIPEYRIDGTIVCHGHVPPEAEADRYVIGHDHPTVTIEGYTRPCYLAGDGVYRGADLLVLPSFNRLVSGVEVNAMSSAEFLSPLVTDVDALAPVVRDEERDETLVFPTLGEFRHKL